MIKILITGSKGFVGKHLINNLKKKKFKLYTSDKNLIYNNSLSNIPKTDFVIHLASKNFLTKNLDDSKFLINNIKITNNIINYCINKNAKLIFLSSYVYGNCNLPTNEKSMIKPSNIYSLSKVFAENLINYYVNNKELECIILRVFNLFGINQNKKFLIPMIIDQVINSKKIVINDISPSRDFLYIDDFIDLLNTIISKKFHSDVFNIGSGKTYKLTKIIEIIQKEFKTNLPIINRNLKRNNEIYISQADISKIRKKYKWSPKTSFNIGIRKIKDAI